MSISSAIQRATTVISNLPYLPEVLLPLDKDALWSELNPANYESVHHFAWAVLAAAVPTYAPFRSVPHLPYEVPEQGSAIEDGQAWFFLNGICTNKSVLRLNGKALADRFQRRINLMHNPSDGVVIDLLECAAERSMEIVSTLESSVADILEDALEHHRKVVLIAHSQGGIISTGALYKLAARLTGSRSRLLSKLELYTFASAATELDLPSVYAEHFFHHQDYVARIGVAGNADQFSGRLFAYDATGHLLNAHYLPNLVKGNFVALDGKPSRLIERLKTHTSTPATAKRRATTVLPKH